MCRYIPTCHAWRITSVWAQLILFMLFPWLEGLILNLLSPVEKLYSKAQMIWSHLIYKNCLLTPVWLQSILLILFYKLIMIIITSGDVRIPIRTVSFLMGVEGKCWFPTHFIIFTAVWFLTHQRCLIKAH